MISFNFIKKFICSRRSKQIDISRINKVLIIACPGIGDTLLASPILGSLLASNKNLKIDFLVRSGRAQLVQEYEVLNNIIEYNYGSPLKSYLKMFFSLCRRYDLAISTSSSDRSVLAAFFAAKYRYSVVPVLSWVSFWKYLLTTGRVIKNDSIPVKNINLKLLDQIGIKRKCSLMLPNQSFTKIQFHYNYSKSRPYAVVHCLPREPNKEWPFDHWLKVISYLSKSGLYIYLTGGPSEYEIKYNHKLQNSLKKNVFSLAGKINFSELTELISTAKIYCGVDTVTSHIAAATGTNSIVIFGPGNHKKWAPQPHNGQRNHVFDKPHGLQTIGNVTLCKSRCFCNGNKLTCEKNTQKKSPCLASLTPELVINAIDRVLLQKDFRKYKFSSTNDLYRKANYA